MSSVADIKVAAQQWYEREVQRAAAAQAARWEAHRAWVDAYVRQELKERLLARGWRASA